MRNDISGGTIHKLPADLKERLKSEKAFDLWGDITPLARNEFICWIEETKKTETRIRRIRRTCKELKAGKRRPCCWAGCPHRNKYNNRSQKISTIDDYISQFPKKVQEILNNIRSIIKNTAKEAEETINYKIPTFKLNGNLVHFAAFKHHIGFYPTSSGMLAFKKELSQYETAKGSVKFPLDKPIPYNIIKKIVKYRVKETASK